MGLHRNTSGVPKKKSKIMTHFKTHHNAKPTKGEINGQPSKTIPDQSMPVREIMRRYAQGLPMEGERIPIYQGEENDLPDFETMDLAERQAYKQHIEAQLEEINIRIKETNEKKVKAAKEAAKAQETQNKPDIEEAVIIEETKKDKKSGS